jgi:hypothetical protein
MVIGISADGDWYQVKVTGLQKEAWIAVEFITIDTPQPTGTVKIATSFTPSSLPTDTSTGTPPQVIMTVINDSPSPTLAGLATIQTPTSTSNLPPYPLVSPTPSATGTVPSFTPTLNPIVSPTESPTGVPPPPP